MLTCRDLAQRHASDYLDRRLGWRARAEVRFHLLLCDNCRRFLAQLRRVRAVLLHRAATPPAPSADDGALQALAEQLHAARAAQKISDPPL